MPVAICYTQIINIGRLAKDFIAENMLITFKDGLPSDLSDYCFILPKDLFITKPFSINQTIEIGKYFYKITAAGSIATSNFKELGHITLIFDGKKQAILDGAVHVSGEYPINLVVGDKFVIYE